MKQFFLTLWNKSFRVQLIFGTSVILISLIVMSTYVITKNQRDFLHAEGLSQASNLSRAVATTSKVWIMANDYVGLEEVLYNFSVYDDLIFVCIINLDGKIIAHTDNSLVGKYIADTPRIDYLKHAQERTASQLEDEKILLHNDMYIDMIRSVNHQDRHIGFVNLRFDQSTRQKSIASTINQGIGFTLISIIVTITFAYVMANSLIKQLLQLLRTMKKVREGNKHIRADEGGVRELSELSHEFNSMLEELHQSEKLSQKLQERLELAFVGSNVGLWDWNIKDDILYFSQIWKSMLGYKDDELPDKFSSWEDNLHADDKETALKVLQKHFDRQTEFYEVVYRLKHKRGHWIWILSRGKAMFDENGKPIRMVGTHADITQDKELQLKYTHQAQIIEQTHDSVISTDLEGNIINWNAGSSVLFGYRTEEVLGRSITVLYPKEDLGSFHDLLNKVKKQESFSGDILLIQKSKRVVSVSLSLSILKDEEGSAANIVWFAKDITQRKAAEEALIIQKDILDHQAHHDVLTNLPNRLLFSDRLEQAIIKAKRHKKRFALFFIDLDQFKQINDSLGHDYGDEVLQIASRRLNKVIRAEDTLARLGGDEFTLLIENLKKEGDVSHLAQKILNVLNQPMIINDQALYISCSIGISFYPDDDTNAKNLLKFADAAMYKAKEEGRNNFQFYSSDMTERAFEHIAMEANLRKALNEKEFLVYYQPQVDTVSNKLTGMEALVRWNHPTMGLVSPARFIPIAEATGLIVELDQWVMKTAMKQIVQWNKDGLNPGKLALNLAMKQLQLKDFVNILQGLLEESACKAEWLELEITEGQIMLNPEEAIKTLNKVSDLGIKLAIDDFGTGYSSLSYLKRLPIDKLKIDQSFVRDLPDDEEDAGITITIIALSQSLNLSVIAEGVETVEQKDFLLKNGCTCIQGYLYAKPMPADEMETLLRKSGQAS